MNEAAGADLSWFWRGWFYSRERLDQAIDSVRTTRDADGTVVSRLYLVSRGGLVMPVTLRLTLSDGSTASAHLAVDAWRRGPRYRLDYRDRRAVVAAELDPAHNLPDVDRSNDRWSAAR
jgi:hypothetical protein